MVRNQSASENPTIPLISVILLWLIILETPFMFIQVRTLIFRSLIRLELLGMISSHIFHVSTMFVLQVHTWIVCISLEDSSINDYFTELCGLWEESEIFRPNSNCTCLVWCQREAMHNARKFKQESLVLIFLAGLNDHYVVVHFKIFFLKKIICHSNIHLSFTPMNIWNLTYERLKIISKFFD
jgi:hypothetical protein